MAKVCKADSFCVACQQGGNRADQMRCSVFISVIYLFINVSGYILWCSKCVSQMNISVARYLFIYFFINVCGYIRWCSKCVLHIYIGIARYLFIYLFIY